ncbi:hypothetical protein [Clostridium beijerinckii]|uniref:Uncharacterized protein n=1 Tax=Clostridium beijerinckii TaxID=1520 RepID=A0A1S8S0R3_CLOBE|nr:hypothetical protein [Clostridium beijerinckii]NRY64160.1 hypothetical protein [Clostridium beijerinckii]OOM59021.1 hypothetical protein CLBCK_36960 [Clostridium beijerinckii]
MRKEDKKFRTREEMICDSIFIIKAPLTYATKYAMIDNICWSWTEYNGKYKGCEYWSEGALKLLNELKKDNEKIDYQKHFRHEHIVPRKILIDKILSLTNLNEEIYKNILNKFMIGTVVTVSEDENLNSLGYRQKMPVEFFEINSPEYENEWLRYKKANIIVKKGSWSDNKFITEADVCF